MFSITKFLSGFNIFSGEKLAKLFFYGIISAFAIGIYHKTFIQKPITNETTAENAQQLQQPKFTTFGCSSLRVQEFRKSLPSK